MKYIRKKLISLITLLAVICINFANLYAAPLKIWEDVKSQTIAPGTILRQITRFTEEGWLNINVLTVNMSNPHISVDSIIPSPAMDKLTTVRNLAASSGAVGAINASFFNYTGSAKGSIIGPMIKNGQVVSANSYFNYNHQQMASLSINSANQVLMSFFKTDVFLILPDGSKMRANQFNKASPNKYEDISIYNSIWSKMSPGSSETYPDMTEIVVSSGIVTDIRTGQPPAQIPEDGFVIVSRGKPANTLMSLYQTGSSASYEVAASPDLSNLKTSVTGSSIILENGNIVENYSHNDPNINARRHPRTLAGSTKDGNTLILATVDGRQNASIGATLKEAAELMLELGAYNAINLDGGGSTTLVARELASDNLSLINRPSDGTARAVANAIGIFSNAPKAELSGIVLDAAEPNVFVGTSIKVSVKGYDKYFNPTAIDESKIKWSVSGVKGSVQNGVFVPSSTGKATLTASIGNIKSSIDINVLSSPVEIKIEPKEIKTTIGKTAPIKITGMDKNGFSASINSKHLKLSFTNDKVGIIEDNVFKPFNTGSSFATVSYGNVKAHAAVVVSGQVIKTAESFEQLNGYITTYPGNIKTQYETSNEQVQHGDFSAKITYEYEETASTKVIFLNLKSGGIPIGINPSKIGIWVYNDHPNANSLKCEISHSKGPVKTIELAPVMDWEGWKHIESNLDGVGGSAAITSIYIMCTSPGADSGTIYLDNITSLQEHTSSIDMKKMPADSVYTDESKKAVSFKKTNSSFRFAALGLAGTPASNTDKNSFNMFVNISNKQSELIVLTGNIASTLKPSTKLPLVTTAMSYKSTDYKNARFIQLDTNSNGIRRTDPKQWQWLFKQLDSSKNKHIFICLKTPPENFTDSLEQRLFRDILSKYARDKNKNIWVVYNGKDNSSYMYNGVKYISVNGLSQYLEVTVVNDKAYYQFKKIQ